MENYDFIPSDILIKARPKNLTGYRFGSLVCVRVVEKHKSGSLVWECRCDCGSTKNIKSSNLVRGATKSCGCLHSKKMSDWHKENKTWNLGKSYTLKNDDEIFSSKKAWADAARKKFGDHCQRCGWDDANCDVHHVVAVASGGEHKLNNALVLCPNCHRVEHAKNKIS